MTAWASDDLASVLIQPSHEFVGWGQGIIKAWNPDTFENVVSYRGGEHQNLAVASGLEALTYAPGDVVMLSRWQPTGGGATSLRIGAGGRVIIPGTGAAEQAVAALRTSLVEQIVLELIDSPAGKDLARSIVAEQATAATVDTSELTTSLTYTDLTTPGPSVQVEVGPAGKLIVWPSAAIGVFANSGNGFSDEAYMGYEISGPTNRAPSDERAARASILTSSVGATVIVRSGGSFIETGLAAGTYTITAKYRVGNGDEAAFNDRTLSVLAF